MTEEGETWSSKPAKAAYDWGRREVVLLITLFKNCKSEEWIYLINPCQCHQTLTTCLFECSN